jgi:uncharacterized protein YbjT (DUF2867 family)
MRILITGASGFVGSTLIPRLQADGHALRALARDPARVSPALSSGPAPSPLEVVTGDVLTGAGLERALAGVEAAYYLIHSMEPSTDGPFAERERRAAQNFAAAARQSGVERVVYLGGLLPQGGRPSPHLASRHAVEEILLGAAPRAVALRASIVIGARSRSFRFLVRLVERLPVLALPAWRDHCTAPLDERDMVEFLVAALDVPELTGRSLDIAGPDVLTYREMIECIAELMLVNRPVLRLGVNLTPVAAPVAAAVAGEDPELIAPLMAGLEGDLLPRDDRAAGLMGVRLHNFPAAVEHALREWEAVEPLAAR